MKGICTISCLGFDEGNVLRIPAACGQVQDVLERRMIIENVSPTALPGEERG